MRLLFDGLVELGDEYRVDEEKDAKHGAIIIGGRDVVGEVENADFSGPVTVGIADERFEGILSVVTGWGYSEYTPMDPDELRVGPHDLVDILRRHEGKHVRLWIGDEPPNMVEEEYAS